MDETVSNDAQKAGGQDYEDIVNAAWRHTFAAHKLIATPKGEMAFLSKENDSNGCIGTVDVSYPSIPLFLYYCPELVNALCRPVLEFASMPVWDCDFAPHDVGRYPLATGQVYAARKPIGRTASHPPYYLYPAGTDVWDPRYIDYLHIKDALADGSVVPAGKGLGNVKRILDAYRAQGGEDVTVEPHLQVFEGLKDLEQDGNTSHVGGYRYPSSDAAFDAACNALKEFL